MSWSISRLDDTTGAFNRFLAFCWLTTFVTAYNQLTNLRSPPAPFIVNINTSGYTSQAEATQLLACNMNKRRSAIGWLYF